MIFSSRSIVRTGGFHLVFEVAEGVGLVVAAYRGRAFDGQCKILFDTLYVGLRISKRGEMWYGIDGRQK
jgi:hypothetical protein